MRSALQALGATGLRAMRRDPIVSAAAILTLALALAATTIVFTVVNVVLVRPLPYRDAAGLISIGHRSSAGTTGPMVASAPGFRDYERARSFSAAAIENETGFNLIGVDPPERLTVLRVSGDWFRVYGVAPLYGRWLGANDQIPGQHHVVVLFHGLWQRRFGGDSTIIGRTIDLNNEPYRVVGIMPPGFKSHFKPRSELVVPLALTTRDFEGRYSSAFYNLTARLRPGTSVQQAATEMAVLAQRLRRERANDLPPGFRLEVQSLTSLATVQARPALLTLAGGVAFLALIACANVASLLLARATARPRDGAVRRALGASSRHMIGKALAESVTLSLVSLVPGLLLARTGLALLVHAFPELPRAAEMSVDAGSCLFGALASGAAGILFGLVPAIWSVRTDVGALLHASGGRGATAGQGERRWLRALVVVEVALAVTLLVGTGLLLESMQRLRRVDPGFEPRHALVFKLSLPALSYASDTSQRLFVRQLTERLARIPGASSVGTTSVLPFSGNWATASVMAEGQVYGSGQDLPIGDLRIVSPGFFSALGVRLIRGRVFSETDDESRPAVTIVDEEFARRMFKRDPIGQRIALDPQPGQRDSSWMTIVGVVAHTAHEALDAPRRIQYYFPYAQRPGRNVAVVMRARGEPASLVREVRTAIKELDPDLPISSLGSLSSSIDASMWQRRLAVLLLALFSCVATTLASLGIYGHMSFMVARRSRDVGIRRALGAPTVELTLDVIRDGLALTTIGVAAGVVLGATLARLLASQLYEVAWLNPAVLIVASLLILVVALAAIVVPASRAMTADPLVVLQSE